MDTRLKILNLEAASNFVENLDSGRRLAVATGWFEVLLADYCDVLADAKREADCLIVLVFGDEGSRKTLSPQSARAQMIAALRVVDRVVTCTEAEAKTMLSAWRPSATVDAEQKIGRNLLGDVLQRHRSA